MGLRRHWQTGFGDGTKPGGSQRVGEYGNKGSDITQLVVVYRCGGWYRNGLVPNKKQDNVCWSECVEKA